MTDKLYRSLISEYTEENLKRISAELIEGYKSGSNRILMKYAARLNLDKEGTAGNRNRIFMKIIMNYHPDRLVHIRNEIDRCYRNGDLEGLKKFARNIALPGYFRDSADTERYNFTFTESYTYEQENFDDIERGETGTSDWEDPSFDFDIEDYGFIEAVKEMMYGNREVDFLPKDLYYLEGELVLSSREIEDLEGLEYCVNITFLDLSDNRISNIFPIGELPYLAELNLSRNQIEDVSVLGGLNSLRVLDLSYNQLEDISELTNLTGLEYLNLTGNRDITEEQTALLRRNGTVVIL